MIIGFSGLAHSGKDTAAAVLVRDYEFIRVGFADKLKRFCQDVFQFSDAQVWGELKEDGDSRYPRGNRDNGEFLTPRHAMQLLGTEWGRVCYPNIWVEDALRIAGRLTEETHHSLYYSARNGIWRGKRARRVNGVVFSDVRFINEMKGIKNAGGRLIRLKRGTKLTHEAAAHSSEEEQLTIPDHFFDAVIHNEEMTKEQFETEVHKLYRELC